MLNTTASAMTRHGGKWLWDIMAIVFIRWYRVHNLVQLRQFRYRHVTRSVSRDKLMVVHDPHSRIRLGARAITIISDVTYFT